MRSTTTEATRQGWHLLANLTAAFVATLILATNPVDADDAPKRLIESTTSGVLDVLRNTALTRDQKQRQIEDIVFEKVDFPTVSRLVLARNWRRLSSEQQAQFMDEFKKHLSVTYGDNVDKYRDESVVITGDRKELRGDWTVLTKVVGGSGASDFLVNYRLRQKDGRWWIIDIIIEGVSMISNFRSQFQEIMANGGPERLLRLLKEKNAAHQPLVSS
jgi:phospholipid transport system substrate-binding protein